MTPTGEATEACWRGCAKWKTSGRGVRSSTARTATNGGFPGITLRAGRQSKTREELRRGKCPVELSFYGTRCGAFAISGKSWSLVERDTVAARQGRSA